MIDFLSGCESPGFNTWIIVINEDFVFDFISSSLEVKDLFSFANWEPKTFEEAESDKFASWQNDIELITSSIRKLFDIFIGQKIDRNSFRFLLMKNIISNLQQLNTENHWIVYFKQKRG